MTLAIATVACGKKITESKPASQRQTENQVTPRTYILQLDGGVASIKNYSMPRAAKFEIPERLKVRRGSTAGKAVEVAYDVNEYDSDDIQFRCTYVPSSNPAELVLDRCVDYDGDDFGDLTGHEFSLRVSDVIQLRFTGAPARDLVVEAVYAMDWI
jgi:hypothetical protein